MDGVTVASRRSGRNALIESRVWVIRSPAGEQVQRSRGENELVMLKGQKEGQDGRGSKGEPDKMTSVRKVRKAQMKGRPENHSMTVSFQCNWISKAEEFGPNLHWHPQYDPEQRHADPLIIADWPRVDSWPNRASQRGPQSLLVARVSSGEMDGGVLPYGPDTQEPCPAVNGDWGTRDPSRPHSTSGVHSQPREALLPPAFHSEIEFPSSKFPLLLGPDSLFYFLKPKTPANRYVTQLHLFSSWHSTRGCGCWIWLQWPVLARQKNDELLFSNPGSVMLCQPQREYLYHQKKKWRTL